MKITLEKLKSTEMYEFLPTQIMNFMGGDFLVFYYWYDDFTSEITDIKGVKVVKEITLLLQKELPVHASRKYYSIGYFQAPFDTQDVLFYQFLKYYFSKGGGKYDKNSAYFQEKNKTLTKFFLEAKKIDLEGVEFRQKNTTYNNVFNIYSRDNFINAVDRFVSAHKQITDPVIMIADAIDTYYQSTTKKSLYGDCIEKVVMAVVMPNGALIPEKMGQLRYLYVGEHSNLVKDDPSLFEAKELLRGDYTDSEIYAKTGWFFNRNDLKWRKPILDKEATVPKLQLNTMFMKSDSKFAKRKEEIFGYMTAYNLDTPEIEKLLRSGWDIYLSDILDHPTLYKHYPSLFKLPIFYGVSNKQFGTDENDYSFYFSPQGYLMMIGNEELADFKTTLLHEVQHAIQHIEGFAQGGNEFVAKMIQAMGGENVKKYFYVRNKIKQLYSSGANDGGVYSYDTYSKFFWTFNFKPTNLLPTREEYYSNIDDVLQVLTNSYLYLFSQGTIGNEALLLSKFLGHEVSEAMKLIHTYIDQARLSSNRLVGQGYNQQQIDAIFMGSYKALAGEIESRDVQHNVEIDEEILGYVMPMTSESIKKKSITTIFDDILSDEKFPTSIGGAVEVVNEGKYIIHLFENISAVPILHEIGHILHDIMGRADVELIIANSFDKNEITDTYGGMEELFCELFLCYLSRQNFSVRFTNDLSKNRVTIDKSNCGSSVHTILDDKFNEIFFPKKDENKEKEFMQRLIFVRELRDLVEKDVVAEKIIEVPKQEFVVSEEVQLGTKTNEIKNLTQLKNYLKEGALLRVTQNKNVPNQIGKIKVVSRVQTNGVYFAEGTKVPESAKSSISGLSYFEYPKSSNITFLPNGFEKRHIDSSGNVITGLGYEYVEKTEQETLSEIKEEGLIKN